MEKLKFKLNKDILIKVRDEANLILFNMKGFGVKEMMLVNNILAGLKDVEFKINNC